MSLLFLEAQKGSNTGFRGVPVPFRQIEKCNSRFTHPAKHYQYATYATFGILQELGRDVPVVLQYYRKRCVESHPAPLKPTDIKAEFLFIILPNWKTSKTLLNCFAPESFIKKVLFLLTWDAPSLLLKRGGGGGGGGCNALLGEKDWFSCFEDFTLL